MSTALPPGHASSAEALSDLKRMAHEHDARGELEHSISNWTASFELSGGGIEEGLHLVEAYLRAGQSDRAIQIARECTESMPSQALPFYILGRALRISWRFRESVQAFEIAHKLRPDWTTSEIGLKQALRQLQDSPRAREMTAPLQARFEQLHGRQVIAGPFRGLRFPDTARGVPLLVQLAGLYEVEVQPHVETLLSQSPRRVINIGGADGYYALGMAMRLPEARVEVFELDPDSQEVIRAGADLNQFSDRVSVHGVCDPESIRSVLQAGDLILCDCEGAELHLLRPERLQALYSCTLLVELHDFIFRDTTAVMKHRFRDSHQIHIVPAHQAPTFPEVPGLQSFSDAERQIIGTDLRPEGMCWAVMIPRTS